MEENNFLDEKKKNINIILIIIIVILVVMLLGLSYYTFFMREDNESNNNENNNTVEESIKTIYEEYGSDIYTQNITEKDLVVEAVLGKVEESFNDLSKEDWRNFVVTRAILFTQYEDYNVGLATGACEDIAYKFGTDDYIKTAMACYLGMSDEEIEVADIDMFNVFGGSTGYMVFKLDDIKDEIERVYGSYGDIFDESFSFINSELISGIWYDKNIDKVFVHWQSNPKFGISARYIVNTTVTDDTYEMKYFDYTALDELEDVNGSVIVTIGDNDDYKLLVEDNIDKFPKKIVTFKLVDGVYKYDSVKDA